MLQQPRGSCLSAIPHRVTGHRKTQTHYAGYACKICSCLKNKNKNDSSSVHADKRKSKTENWNGRGKEERETKTVRPILI